MEGFMTHYMGDMNWWDNRFEGREKKLLKPEAKLVEWERSFIKGNVLDIACGEGRNALYLASLGYDVTAVDFSEVALTHLKEYAKEYQLDITTKQMDCLKTDVFKEFGLFHAIIVNHYRLSSEVLEELLLHLNPQGYLWLNGFVTCPENNPNITKSDLLQLDQYRELRESGYEVVAQEYETELGAFACVVICQREDATNESRLTNKSIYIQ